MDPIELTAKSLDEGKKLAAEKLGVSPDQVEVKVLEETKGLFGRMSYKLSATSTAASTTASAAPAAETSPAPAAAESASEEAPTAVTKPNRARKKPAAAPKEPEVPMQSEINTLETQATPAPSTGSAPRRLGKKVAVETPAPAPAATPSAPAASAPVVPEAPKAEEATETKAEAPKRLGRGRKSSDEPVAATASATSPEPAAESAPATTGGRSNRSRDEEGEDDGVVATEEQAEQFRKHLQDLLATSGLAVELRVTGMEGKYVNLAIDDAVSDDPHRADSSYLIGRSGEVLNALQYLANLIGKQQFNDGVRVVLDGAGWREKREAKLQEYTMDVVRQVLEREEEALLDALPAFERRIVHRIVQDIDGVKTYSEGEEPNRRVVISPA